MFEDTRACFVALDVLRKALKGEQFCKGFFATACYAGGRARVTSATAVKVVGMLQGVLVHVLEQIPAQPPDLTLPSPF